jgi:glycosyltransferase involved in cell wall biosynthesis
MSVERDSILLVLPVPLRRDGAGRLLVERQAANGLDRWAENFRRLVVACPLQPDASAADGGTVSDYVDADRLASRERMEFTPLPWADQLGTFLGTYLPTREVLAEKIRSCEYLSFAIGGLIGDWGNVAALEAIRQRRRFSVWTDRVEYQVVKGSHAERQGLRKVYRLLRDNLVMAPLMKQVQRHIIRKCDLGLFHGLDCFHAYSPYCRNAHLVHNIHLKPEERIGPELLRRKLDRIRSGAPLRLLYAGRVAGMKGPLDWVRVMATLQARGLAFRASWVGDGPLFSEMRDEVERLNLSQTVELPGFVGDRRLLLEAVRDSELFVFCHKTPESPRCLIEALMSGSAILGYGSSYPRDLLGHLAGRLLVGNGDATGLAERIAYFDRHRDELAELVQSCYQLGANFSDRAVFQHRSSLIRNHLGSGACA